MNEFEKNMEDIFDIEVESTDIEPVEESKPSKPVPKKEDKDDPTKDYEYTRGQKTWLLTSYDGHFQSMKNTKAPKLTTLLKKPSK